MPEPSANNPDVAVFQRLRRSYLLALSLIALALLAEHFLVEGFLAEQAQDANIVNVAGRQRMLSQRIAKFSLLPEQPDNALAQDIEELKTRHDWLKLRLVKDPVLPDLHALDTTVAKLVEAARTPTKYGAGTQDAGAAQKEQSIIAASETFLQRMDAIVDQIARSATTRVERLQRAKKWIGLGTAFVLLLELLFIFRPIGEFIRRQFFKLREEREAQQTARAEAEAAVLARERSLSELSALNQAIDRAAIFATLRYDGRVIHLSRKFAELLGVNHFGDDHGLLPPLLHDSEERRDYFANLIASTRTGDWQGEWHVTPPTADPRWLEVTLVSNYQQAGMADVFLLASDITDRKQTQQSLDQLNADRLAEEVARGQQRASQIVEAQEKERLRVARDLHDGIGQKLTALKFSLESLRITPKNIDKSQERVSQLRALSKEIILGVRLATFNLTPPELDDYGLAAALAKLAAELSRMTGERIVFVNETPAELSLDATTKINLYRTVQEAVNNAVKYARANYILVTLSASEQLLSITVDDDGEGFDREDLGERTDGSGLGLSFMEERITNLGGRMFMRSNIGGGTRITINLPV